MSDFQAPWWLPGGHLQTIIPALLPQARPLYLRQRVETPDGDFIDFDWTAEAPGREDQPTVLVFHGLEGSSDSHYARALARVAVRRGCRAVVMHFRGCSGSLNRQARFYHSGDHEEIDWAVRTVARACPGPLYTVGVSLGGNALLCWLGTHGSAAARLVIAAAAVCAPLDLAAGGAAIGRGFNLLYTRMFLRSLKPKCLAKLAQFPGLFDRQRMLEARTLYEFDQVVTAPLHGFRDVDDYWTRASSHRVLSQIGVPTLLLNPRNDPFMPARAWPQASALSSHVRFETPDQGGHVGFYAHAGQGRDWLPERVMDYLLEGR